MATEQDSSNLHSVCGRCNAITIEALKHSTGCVHHPSLESLIESASHCELCKLIFEACVRYSNTQRQRITEKNRSAGPIRLLATKWAEPSKLRHRSLETIPKGRLSTTVFVFVGELKTHLSSCMPTIQLEMYALKGSEAEKAGIPALGEMESHTACEANFSRIRMWIQHCKRHHGICSLESIRPITGPSPMPKRLIYLGPLNDSAATSKIINTKGRQEEYVTLSYCWGPKRHLSTTKRNLRNMEESIPVDLLPQTITDAFQVARELDVRYIWIDALCIVQDDDEDWETEAKRMGAIYANAYFTIAATTAEHSGQGFLKPRTSNSVAIPFRCDSTSEGSGAVYFRHPTNVPHDYYEYITSSPLLNRAWVLQETLLSRRTVHFSSKQIYWECRSAFHAEDGITEGADSREHAHEFLNMLHSFAMAPYSNRSARLFFTTWINVLQRYSTLSITRPSDKLPALSGLASLAERILGHQYLYGIWNFNLAYGLFWQPAAREGEILFERYFPEEDSAIQFVDMTESSQQRGALKLLGQIHPCHVTLDLRPQPKPCRSDRKLLEIPITPPEYAFAEDESQLLTHAGGSTDGHKDSEDRVLNVSLLRVTEGRLMGEEDPGGRNVCRFDGERGNETDFFFLRLSCAGKIGFHHCRGLLLRQVMDALGVYERVGVGWSTDPLWHSTPESVMTLI